MNPSILSFEHVNKRFGKALAIEELSLDLAPGDVFALLGPNGAGKSTALRMALDLIRPSSGQIQILGRPAAKLNAATRAQIGYVAESHTLPGKMTIKQLLDYLRPMYPAWDDALMQRLIDLFGLPMNQRCRHFSRGMRMKTAFVCALAYHPKLLVLDEPFSGLDPQVMRDLIEALVDLLADEGMTVLMSSHDIDDVERLATTIGILDQGSVRLTEELDSLLARHREMAFRFEEPVKDEAPNGSATWCEVDLRGRQGRLIETAFDPVETPSRIRKMFPGALDIEDRPMSLKKIYLATMDAITNPTAKP